MKNNPKILEERTNNKTYRTIQILLVPDLFAVYYDGQPISVRHINKLLPEPIKYSKTTHSSRYYAEMQVETLNKEFNTDKFKVVTLVASDRPEDRYYTPYAERKKKT